MLRYIKTIQPKLQKPIKIYKTNSIDVPFIGVSIADLGNILLYRYSTEKVKEMFSEQDPFWVDTGHCQTESKKYLGFLVKTYF